MVTLAEVAQHAGVSASTVSYVLSGKRSISAGTRQRVEQSIQELGYHPNAGARALASSRSNIIALMVPLRTDMYVPGDDGDRHRGGHHGPHARLRRAAAHRRGGPRRRAPGHRQRARRRDDPDGRRTRRRAAAAAARHRPAVRADRAARRHQRADLRRPRLRGDGRAVRRASGRCSATATSPSSARPPRSTSGTPASPSAPSTDCAPAAAELRTAAAAPALRGRVRRDGRDPGPDLRRTPGHHRLRRAERVRGRAAARAAAPAGPGRARGRVGGRGLPGPGRRPGLGAADLRRHPRAGDGPARRGAAGRQARRPRHRRSRAART